MKLNNVVFFDGECLVCNRFAIFILKRNKQAKIKLAPINGITYLSLNLSNEIKQLDSILFYKDNKIMMKVEAVAMILKNIGGIYFLFGILLNLIPRFMSNFIYELFAKYRTKIFGKIQSCAIISHAQKKMILD